METPLQLAIDKAVAAQYPAPQPPTPLQKIHKVSEKDRWVSALDQQLKAAGFGPVESEFRFHPERMWRFDRALPALKIAIEVDGGSFGRVVQCHACRSNVLRRLKDGRMVPVREGGRHNTGAGMQADHEKMNAAVALGWRVLRFTPKHIKDGYALNLILTLAKLG